MPEIAPAPAPGQPPQAPFGATPATQPTPNRGYEAAAAQKLGLIGKQLTEILNLVGVGTDMGKDILTVLKTVSKYAPSGSSTPAQERNQIENMAMKNAQSNQQMQSLKQQGASGGAPSPGAPPPPPMPRAA